MVPLFWWTWIVAEGRAVRERRGGPLSVGVVVALVGSVLAVVPAVTGAGPVGAQSSSVYADEVLADDPVALWRFEENAGAVAGDEVGALAATLVGASWDDATGVAGSGSAVSFDGVDDFVTVGGPPELALESFSFETWFRFDPGQPFVWDGFPKLVRSRTFGLAVQRTPEGTVEAWAYSDECGSRRVETGESFEDGGWHHLVFTLGPDATDLYVDGALAGSDDGTPGVCYGDAQVAFGRDGNHDSDYFKGALDEVAWYDYPLSAERVARHYCTGAGTCGAGELAADAGPDQSVVEGGVVQLAGRVSVPGGATVESSELLVVDGRANIFGAGHGAPPAPGGGGGGVLPVDAGIDLSGAESVSVSDAAGVTTAYGGCGGPPAPPDGIVYQGSDIASTGGISGIIDDHQQMLLGVFLGADEPADPAPGRLNLTGRHDDVSFAPQIGQVFFIGDGVTAGGVAQRFVVPGGATRVFVGLAGRSRSVAHRVGTTTTATATRCGFTPTVTEGRSALRGGRSGLRARRWCCRIRRR